MKINVKHKKTIEKELKKFNGYDINYQNIKEIVSQAEIKLSTLGVYPHLWEGAALQYLNGNSYDSSIVENILFIIERFGENWYLTTLKKEKVYPRQHTINNVEIDKKYKEEVFEAIMRSSGLSFSIFD